MGREGNGMKIIVCGGRDFEDYKFVNEKLDIFHSKTPITCLIHGDARGADRMAGHWAQHNRVYCVPYPADWNKYGNAAGPIRNGLMLAQETPDCVIAFPGGYGTDHMVKITRTAGIRVIEYNPWGNGGRSLFEDDD